MSAIHDNPLNQLDILGKIFSFLDFKEVCLNEQVSKLWQKTMNQSVVWKQKNTDERIPLVNAKRRNFKEDFKVLFPITLTARAMACLGEFIGEVPMISEEEFNRLRELAQVDSRFRKVFMIVEPHYIKRANDPELLKGLLKHGDFKESDYRPTDSFLMVPYSFKNLLVLASHPVKGDKDVVLRFINSEILKQEHQRADKVKITIIREECYDLTCGSNYENQKSLVKQMGFDVAPLRLMTLFNFVQILNTQTCPNFDKPGHYARTSDSVIPDDDEQAHQIIIGHYKPNEGLEIMYDPDDNEPDEKGATGVIPCLEAKAPSFEKLPAQGKRSREMAFGVDEG